MDATQTELLEQAKNNAMMDVRVSMPARIVSFDPATKTASVEIGLKMVNADDTQSEYPPLVDCPCLFTRGGGFHLVHPYKAGDKGIVLFSDRCFDGWFQAGQVAPPMDFRVHSMSDAYFIGGADCLDDVSPIVSDAMFIGKDDNSAGVTIKASGDIDLNGVNISPSGIITLPDGTILNSHVHGNVQSGNSTTGEPQ
jgi:hypothetical protein